MSLRFHFLALAAVASFSPVIGAASAPEALRAASGQACSYDGAPVRVQRVSGALPSDCRDMVARIMTFTGLPQNFVVVEGPVPNAAAIIMLDDREIPQRVIAFNRDFMNIVGAATRGNAWAPISVMAHEIGHHLSGHTIVPGGSQPPIELEADKFSGFVLYKMGASLSDAQAAMAELVPDGPDGKTHPGRRKRLDAIRDGWQQACQQQGGDCASATVAARAQGAPISPAPATDAAMRAPRLPASPPSSAPAVATAPAAPGAAGVDVLPAPGGTPSKLDRFIHDEFGVLDANLRATAEQTMFEHARSRGVEIVTLLVKDLHGLSGDDYAQAMLRQLRVGKLDVGNGAVLVVAPLAGEVGLAMGPGIALESGSHDRRAALARWLERGWPQCQRKQACGNWSELLFDVADRMRRDTAHAEWTIRYASHDALMRDYLAFQENRRETGARFDPEADPGYRKIVVLDGEVVTTDAGPGYAQAFVNPAKARSLRAVHVRSPDGYDLMLYSEPRSQALMPTGALRAGQRYRFVARTDGLSHNPKDTQAFDLLSYDLAP